ncbi:MAG TPA: maleylpyruvate isomerase family mycothiol-dependent enzyme [Acidimicrobiales bacterium]
MDDVFIALREQLEELRAIVDGLDEHALALPSACEGWSIADVLLHLAQTNEMATASARGSLGEAAAAWVGRDAGAPVRTDVNDIADAAVARDRGATGTEVRARWIASASDMAHALEACDPSARVQWVAGDMAPRSLATTRIAETWIHTGDVCAGIGTEQPESDRIWHIARLVHRTLPYAFLREGLAPPGGVRFALTSPTRASVVWEFGPDDAPTTIAGPAVDLCRVAGQRASASGTALVGTGPDAENTLRVMRTFA